MGIRILDEDLVIYRRADGVPVAMTGICPHRFAPLSLGKVDGDDIICGYHGLRFDPHGACTHNPHGKGMVPPRARLTPYPVEDRSGAIWVWMGDPEHANASDILSFDFLTDTQAWAGFSGYLHINSNYQLVIDNLLDLTHAAYLHPNSVGVDPKLRGDRKLKYKFSVEDGVITSDYSVEGTPPSPLLRLWTDREIGDIYSPISLHLPSNLVLDLSMTDRGMARGTGSRMPSVHLIVPETETSCHYFYALSRNGRLDDPALSESMANIIRQAFVDEDEPMIRAVHDAMRGRDFFALEPAILETDAAGLTARRALAKLIKQEQAALKKSPAGPSDALTESLS
ncbi:hypothetical protein ASD39_19240 [Sphingomonas sp. Root50]|nr:hypothetical protein ASD17_15735 [Sphingomonas sp. Root1294]KQY72083.1 hypothetical protein ASD39_19240 [Sphingomonas sp. Root50]KRB94647.1 hypothetical protein ASE22_01515 [Sphingomonas sp. Root720]